MTNPQDLTYWYISGEDHRSLTENLETEILIIGGGMSGLSAAQAFAQKGKKVVLLEQFFCGAGASGKSSGFITPNSELGMADFVQRFGPEVADKLWHFILSGQHTIKNNIERHALACDYSPQPALELALSRRSLKKVETEYRYLEKFGYAARLLDKKKLTNYLNSNAYCGGIEYVESFGINGYQYCQRMKKVLTESGVQIFENSPVTKIEQSTAYTSQGRVSAQHIIVCTDRFTPQLGLLKQEIYHVQTFLMISQPLEEHVIRAIFPKQLYMVWDTDLIYSYYRIAQNNRLLLGGGTLLSTYATHEYHDYRPVIRKLTKYFKRVFPQVDIQFEHMWPGLIGISKDIVPIAGKDKDNSALYYAGAGAGLPFSAALGRYSAEHILEGRTEFDAIFSPYRKFFIGSGLQRVLGTRLSFALSNGRSEIFDLSL